MSQGGSPSTVGAINVIVGASIDQASFDAVRSQVATESQKMTTTVKVGPSGAGMMMGGTAPGITTAGGSTFTGSSMMGGQIAIINETTRATKKLNSEQENTKRGLVDIGLEAQKSYRGAIGVITKTTAALAAMAAAAKGVVFVIKEVWTGLHGGEVAANKFKAAIGDKSVAEQFEKQRDRLNEINKLQAERQTMSLAEKAITAGRAAAMREEALLLQKSQVELGKQLDALDKIARNKKKGAEWWDMKLGVKEEGKELRQQQRERDEEHRQEMEKQDHESRQRKLQDAADIGRAAADELGGADQRRHNEELKKLAEARRVANEFERRQIDLYEKDLIDAFIKGLKDREREIGEIFANAIEASVSSQFGAQNVTTLLRDISTKVSAIQVAIPRSQ